MSSLLGHLSGNMISQLHAADKILSSDLFLVARGSKSNAISYKDMLTQLSVDLFDSLSLGSMAWENKYKYSLSSHSHDEMYSKLSVRGTLSPGGKRYPIASVKTVADSAAMNRDAVETIIYAVDQTVVQQIEPPIGMLKFLYRKSKMTAIDDKFISSDNFDGWVYPNGYKFTVAAEDFSRFEKAIRAYGSTTLVNGRYEFTVPTLSNNYFFELSKAKVANLDPIAQSLCAGVHVHAVDPLVFNGDIIPVENSYINTYGGNSNKEDANKDHIHFGVDNKKAIASVDIDINLDQIQFIDLSCGFAGDNSKELIMKNNALPTMIYIGGIKRS